MPRRRRGGLAVWLSETATPVFVLDARRVLLYFNPGCEALTGWSAADVLGRTCDYACEPDPSQVESVTCALAPPPEILAGKPAVVPATIICKSGAAVARELHFFPLPNPRPEDFRILGVLCEPRSPPDETTSAPEALHARLAAVRAALRREDQLDGLMALSPGMARVLEQVHVAIAVPIAVHLNGEAGSGRDYIARMIHAHGPRRLQAFLPLDCAALTDFELQRTLRRLTPKLDDERDPAFTPGAVCLRNVTQLPRDLQQLLLDEFLTSNADVRSRPRLFSSDHSHLEEAVDSGRLLPELAFRLTTLTIQLPPLRDRTDDLPLLCQYFLEQINRNVDRQLGGFSHDVMDQLRRYNWPGNVRELRLVVEECHAAAKGPLVTESDLPFRFRTGVEAQRIGPRRTPQSIDLADYLESVERREIERALSEARHNRTLAARLLGLTRPRLYRRMLHLGLEQTPADPPDEEQLAD